MIRKLAASALLIGAMGAMAPLAVAQQLPPEIQEMVDKVHLGPGGELVAVEAVPDVFQRLPSGDLLHRPSGFICQHTAASLDGLMPGFVTIFDERDVGHNIGCGMVGRAINISLFLFTRTGDPASAIEEYAAPARRDSPPARNAAAVEPATAEALGLPEGTPFASDIWVDRKGEVQAIYLAQIGDWFINGRLTTSRATTDAGNRHIRRQFEHALATIAD